VLSYPEPTEPSPHIQNAILRMHFNIIFQYTSRSTKWSARFSFTQ